MIYCIWYDSLSLPFFHFPTLFLSLLTLRYHSELQWIYERKTWNCRWYTYCTFRVGDMIKRGEQCERIMDIKRNSYLTGIPLSHSPMNGCGVFLQSNDINLFSVSAHTHHPQHLFLLKTRERLIRDRRSW